MNFSKFFNKWWLMLANGILLIFLSYHLFSNPDKMLSASVITAGFIATLTGSISITGYFWAAGTDKSILELLCGACSVLLGLLFLSGFALSQVLLSSLFLVYMVINALILTNTAWSLKQEASWWWLSIVHLLYTFLIVYFVFTDTVIPGVPITVFVGIQFIFSGLFMIIFAFFLRKTQLEYGQTIRQIKEAPAELVD